MTTMPQGRAAVAFRTRAPTRRSSLELAVRPSAVRTARHWTASVLADASPPRDQDLIDSIVLLVSELVTNAIEAAGAPGASAPAPARTPRVWLAISGSPDLVRIEVHDSTHAPVPPTCDRDEDEESGRGLQVISALATDWGWQPELYGKVVWCELAVSGC